MLMPKESRDLKKTYKRLAWFLCGVFVIALLESYLLMIAGASAVLNGFIIILSVAILYLIFLAICAKIDKKKAEKREKEKTKDPFSE